MLNRKQSEVGIHDRSGNCTDREEAACRNDVRQIEDRRDQRASDEAKLHSNRHPSRIGHVDAPFLRQLRQHGSAGKPERHGKQFGQRENNQDGAC